MYVSQRNAFTGEREKNYKLAMCETPKDETTEQRKPPKDKPKSYYYDDAHGYEDFDPEVDEQEDEDELS